jgi:predicted dehydrogenase
MRALLIGAGGMGRAWARNLSNNADVTLAGWVDVRPGAAQAAADELGLSVEYLGVDVAGAIASVAPDFVVDVTPPEVHHDVTLAALSAGVPVIGEKPMAASMAQAREMVAAADQAGKLYMVSQSRRYNGQIRAYRRIVRERLGPLGILNSDFYIGAHFGGFRDEMPNVLLLDMAIHTFDAARYISGADPLSVYAEEFNPHWSWYKGDASATALFEMTGGLRYSYRGSWCAEGLHTSWEGDWRAVGPNGSAVWAGNEQPKGAVVTETGGFHSKCDTFEAPSEPVADGIAGSLEEFLNSLRTGEKPNGECHDNIQSLAMVFAAIESAKRGERVALPEILKG